MNVVAHARVMNGVEYVAPAEAAQPRRVDLTQYHRDLARRNPVAFEQECGDGFVAALYAGAELAGVLSVDETDSKTRASLEASLSGSVGGFTAAGKFKSSTDKGAGTRRVRVTFYQTGGSGSPMPTTEEGFVAAIEKLPALAANDPHNYQIQIQSYRTLPGYSVEPEEDRSRFRETVATSYGRLQTLRDAVVEALELKAGEDYADADKDQRASAIRGRMQALHDELLKRMERMRTFSRLCAFYDEDMRERKTDPDPCPEETDLDLRDDYAYRLRLPVLNSPAVNIKVPSQAAAAVIEQHVREVSRRRCERDLEDPGCLLEGKIEELSNELSKKLAG